MVLGLFNNGYLVLIIIASSLREALKEACPSWGPPLRLHPLGVDPLADPLEAYPLGALLIPLGAGCPLGEAHCRP